MTLSWINPPDEDLAGIQLLIESNGIPAIDTSPIHGELITPTGSAQTQTITGLIPDREYRFSLVAWDSSGNLSIVPTVIVQSTAVN